MDTILREIETIFRDVFDDDKISLTEATSPEDIAEWDSLSQLNILLSVERHFQIKISVSDIVKIKSVGDIIRTVKEKLV